MQVPSNIQGLRNVLRSIGYDNVLTGLDIEDPEAKNYCRNQINWVFDESGRTTQDEARKKKALSYIERFPWDGISDNMYGLNASPPMASILEAVDELTALLEEEQILNPVDITEIEEDEDGEAQSITITTEELLDAAGAVTNVPWADLPEFSLQDLRGLLKRFKPKPRETLSFAGKGIEILPWTDLGKPKASDLSTKTVLVNSKDFTWYGPYSNLYAATRSAWGIASKGDNLRRKVPFKNLKMVKWSEWPPAKARFSSTNKQHRSAARVKASEESLDAYMQEFHDTTEVNFVNTEARVYKDMWLELYPVNGAVFLSSMLTLDPGKGNAKRALSLMTALADRYMVPMVLIAKATGTLKNELSTTKLKKLYARHGFKADGGNVMYRAPRVS